MSSSQNKSGGEFSRRLHESNQDPCDLGIVLIENRWKAERRPYHKQKLAKKKSDQEVFVTVQNGLQAGGVIVPKETRNVHGKMSFTASEQKEL